jgi:hypothetical protein
MQTLGAGGMLRPQGSTCRPWGKGHAEAARAGALRAVAGPCQRMQNARGRGRAARGRTQSRCRLGRRWAGMCIQRWRAPAARSLHMTGWRINGRAQQGEKQLGGKHARAERLRRCGWGKAHTRTGSLARGDNDIPVTIHPRGGAHTATAIVLNLVVCRRVSGQN